MQQVLANEYYGILQKCQEVAGFVEKGQAQTPLLAEDHQMHPPRGRSPMAGARSIRYEASASCTTQLQAYQIHQDRFPIALACSWRVLSLQNRLGFLPRYKLSSD